MAQIRNLTAAQCVGASLKVVADRWPYIAHLLYRIRLYERPGLGMMTLDKGLRLHYDPELVMGPLQQMRYTPTIVAHEPWHKLLDHETRKDTHALRGWAIRYERVKRLVQMLDPNTGSTWDTLWNVCGDYEINTIVAAAGWEWPTNYQPLLFGDHNLPDTWRAEQAVEWFIVQAEKLAQQSQPGKGSGSGAGGEGECPEDGSGKSKKGDEGDGQQQQQPGSEPQEQGGEAGMDDEAEAGEGDGEAEEDAEGAGGGGGEGEVEPPAEPDAGDAGDGEGEGDTDPDEDGGEAAPGAGGQAGGDAGKHPAEQDGGDAHSRGVGRGRCGGCAGHPEAYESDNADDAPDPMSEDEVAIVRQRVAEDTVEYAQSHGAGYGVGNAVLAWARDFLKPPKVNWRQHFSRETRSAVTGALGEGDTRKYDRPSRRAAVMKHTGWGKRAPILPVKHRTMPQVFVVADSSGSMGSGARSRFNRLLSETGGLLLQARADVWACSVDCGVQAVVKVRRPTDLQALCKGGGGTDIMPGVREALKPEYKTDVLIILTDGELYGGGRWNGWPAPEDIPARVRVVVGIINERGRALEGVPKHLRAHAVHIHDKED